MPTALTLTLTTNPVCPSLQLGDNSTITLLCAIHGYSLEDIQVSWEATGVAKKSLKTENFQKKGDRFYRSSKLTLPLGEWNKLQEFTCKVTQLETKNISTQTISKCTGTINIYLKQNLNLNIIVLCPSNLNVLMSQTYPLPPSSM